MAFVLTPQNHVIDRRGAGLPPATDSYDDDILLNNDGLYIIDIFQTAATAATATFTDYTTTGYRGAQAGLPQTPLDGQTYYDTSEHQWYHVVTSNGAQYWVSGGAPAGWIHGNYASAAEALHAIDRHRAAGVTSGVIFTGTAVQNFSDFVASVDPETERRWQRV